jgi:hypothetical protein
VKRNFNNQLNQNSQEKMQNGKALSKTKEEEILTKRRMKMMFKCRSMLR